jgi:hypothetical protein
VWVVECIISLVTIELALAVYCACVTGVMVLGFFAAKKRLRTLLFCVRSCRMAGWLAGWRVDAIARACAHMHAWRARTADGLTDTCGVRWHSTFWAS